MTRAAAAAVALTLLALVGCGAGAGPDPAHVLRLASPGLAGIDHDAQVAYFVDRLAKVSGGRLRVTVVERRLPDGTPDDDGALRTVARGATELGWAHARSLSLAGARAFDVLDVPLLLDGYDVQAALVRSRLAAAMLADADAGGVTGLALLAGPLSRPVGTRTPLRAAADFRGLAFGAHRSRVADAAIRALGARPLVLTYEDAHTHLYHDIVNRLGPQAGLEDDLDSVFFGRYGGGCQPRERGCDTSTPWVTTNVVLWARPIVLFAHPGSLRRLSARERGWLRLAARDAARRSADIVRAERGLVPELCAAGVRFTRASAAQVAGLRRAWLPLYGRLASRPGLRAAMREIGRLRRRAARDGTLPPPRACARRPSTPQHAHGVRSPLPDGVYRARLSGQPIGVVRSDGSPVAPTAATLTLSGDRWRLSFNEPGDYVESGTFAGMPLRTAWFTAQQSGGHVETLMSVVRRADGLHFHVVNADEEGFYRAAYEGHVWRRIGGG